MVTDGNRTGEDMTEPNFEYIIHKIGVITYSERTRKFGLDGWHVTFPRIEPNFENLVLAVCDFTNHILAKEIQASYIEKPSDLDISTDIIMTQRKEIADLKNQITYYKDKESRTLRKRLERVRKCRLKISVQ